MAPAQGWHAKSWSVPHFLHRIFLIFDFKYQKTATWNYIWSKKVNLCQVILTNSKWRRDCQRKRGRWRCKYTDGGTVSPGIANMETFVPVKQTGPIWRFPLGKDDFHIDPECHGLRVSVDSWILFESYFNFMVLVIKLLKSNTSMKSKFKTKRNKTKEANPKPPIYKSTRVSQSHPATPRWSTNEKTGRQHSA